MTNKQKEIANWRDYLVKLNAPEPLLVEFDETTKIAKAIGSKDDIQFHVIEVCLNHKFTAPFEHDGYPRVVRDGDPCPKNATEENCYRRGYYQGFVAALELMKEQKSIIEIDTERQSLLAWRRRPFQIIQSQPGSDEGEATWLKKES